MEVLVADCLGFCGGVKHALSLAYMTLRDTTVDGIKLYLYGELVHNANVVNDFIKKGASIIGSSNSIREKGTVIIRAHGICDDERKKLEDKGVEIVDATCPVVLKGQSLVRSSLLPVLIFGYKGHSEVTTLVGSRKDGAFVISEENDLFSLEKGEYNGIVQTTFSTSLLDDLIEKASKIGIRVNVLNEICKASVNRRAGVKKLLDKVDAFVVVGDHNSANTRELVSIVEKAGLKCFLVEDENDISEEIYSYKRVGLSAGASTPKEIYDRVIKNLEDESDRE